MRLRLLAKTLAPHVGNMEISPSQVGWTWLVLKGCPSLELDSVQLCRVGGVSWEEQSEEEEHLARV